MRLRVSCGLMLLITAATAYATPQMCADHLRRRQSVTLTRLLTQAFTPYLKKVHQEIHKLSPAQIQSYARSSSGNLRAEQIFMPPFSADPRLGYDGAYMGMIDGSFGIFTLSVPFTSFNRPLMSRLLEAVLTLDEIILDTPRLRSDAALAKSRRLLHAHTFAREDLRDALFYADVSVLQAAAQLTSDPVANLSAENLFVQIMQQKGSRPSLMVLYSLFLPPSLLGPNGSDVYVREPLMLKEDGQLTFTPKLRAFLKRNHDRFLQSPIHRDYEFGHGCPVGHCVEGDQRSGLQYYLDAISDIFTHIAKS